jgi:hypothetical protein
MTIPVKTNTLLPDRNGGAPDGHDLR